ncbi:hypothetical protein VTL71DRAFT_5077 [Oculimacula yallundae]|uniref:DUF7918 domain-containing protein n=1 Tax=Oculimacula yallundae TaxID=86028 RepID=A0ABR4C113_9HELO
MAILELYPGLRVNIVVEGQELPEYDHIAEHEGEEDSDKVKVDQDEKQARNALYQRSVTTTKYIEASSCQKFTISLNVQQPFRVDSDFLGFEIFIDGKSQSSPLLTKSAYLQSGVWSKVVEGVYKRVAGNVVLRSMIFAELNTISESEHVFKSVLDEQAKCLAQIGEIVVVVARRNHVNVQAPPMLLSSAVALVGDSSGQGNSGATKYHVKLLAKDAQSHSMVLGEKVVVDKTKLKKVETKLVDGPDLYLAKFVFKYRSRKQLQSLLVIGRSPSPEPAPEVAEAVTEAVADSPSAHKTPTPPPSTTKGERRLAELKEDPKKKEAEIARHMRECSIKAEGDEDAASVGTVKAEVDAFTVEPSIKQEKIPVAAPTGTKRERAEEDESATITATARLAKKPKPRYKVTTFIDLTYGDDAIVVE